MGSQCHRHNPLLFPRKTLPGHSRAGNFTPFIVPPQPSAGPARHGRLPLRLHFPKAAINTAMGGHGGGRKGGRPALPIDKGAGSILGFS